MRKPKDTGSIQGGDLGSGAMCSLCLNEDQGIRYPQKYVDAIQADMSLTGVLGTNATYLKLYTFLSRF